MAKKNGYAALVWEPPPVTREEALTPETTPWMDTEQELNELIFPAPLVPLSEWEKVQADREQQKKVFKEEEWQRSRNFDVDIGNVTGQDPGLATTLKKKY